MAFYVNPTAYADIRRRLQDLSDESYSDAELLQYINDAQKDFSIVGCYQGKDTTSSLTAESSITHADIVAGFGQDIIEIKRVDIGGKPLAIAPVYEEVSWPASGQTTATGWMDWGETVYLDAAMTGTATIWFTYTPLELGDTESDDVISVPARWYPAIVAFACYRCLDSSQDPQAAALLAEYNTMKLQAAYVYGNREDQPKPAQD